MLTTSGQRVPTWIVCKILIKIIVVYDGVVKYARNIIFIDTTAVRNYERVQCGSSTW